MTEHQYYNRTDDELALYREAWDSINSLGGTVKDDDFIGQAGNITVDNALGMLEITFRHCHRPREFGSEWCICGDNFRSKVHHPETAHERLEQK